MVIAIHTAAFRDFGTLGNNITDNGKYGVQIFFVISGFTIARTYRNATGFGSYFGRRMMRIAPLYIVVIAFAFYLLASGYNQPIYWMTLYNSEADAYNLLMHVSFMSGWDARVANSILGVEWSIPIEVFWYAVLPLVLPIASDQRRRFAIFLGLLVLAGMTKVAEHLILPKHAAHFMPLSYGAYFYLGAVAETLRDTFAKQPATFRRRVWYGSILLFAVTLCVDTGLNAAFFALATAGLIVARPGTHEVRGVLGRKPFLFLGSISYSLYLMHILVIRELGKSTALQDSNTLVFFGTALILTILVSMFTYLTIERPTNRLGARLFGLRKGHISA
ncbi:acyltransferase family protein [Roseovarius phycicola]|uniref:Acyltransferase n=1 Tax=Roseovarius phycicola TaxID=3080976 RepID=A0ABZ2HEK7_9RHOB